MNENTKRLLIVAAVVCFLAVAVLYRNHGRFQTMQETNPGLALDARWGLFPRRSFSSLKPSFVCCSRRRQRRDPDAIILERILYSGGLV